MNDIVGHTDRAPRPAGPYSQSRRRGSVVACAGQAGIRADGSVAEGFVLQFRQTLENLRETLAASGADLTDVIQVRVFLTDPAQFAEMNEVYADFFTDPLPVRTTVTVTLPAPLLVEADLLAVVAD
ncbi:2-iminobutanoate/2-iminopropanoate deaminase [Microbacterium sp. AK009]|uniref:RidA family protein n=1 Tax=Microbacterium sp. AK009 TaxID=2723068 RepID=UPI0015CE8250|nr:Rid family hydrolase [Microbacterium sp. AK009]NYF16642.1 2-iminobutanoate/2-iminopropanoate deaminase [Microbacterium sp. AK009]